MAFRCPDAGRIVNGRLGTAPGTTTHGAYFVPTGERNARAPLKVLAGDGGDAFGWEHVSVSLPHRCPTWAEMCKVKAMFWSPEDAVMQLHPPRSSYVDVHPHCLHLWRPTEQAILLPPRVMV